MPEDPHRSHESNRIIERFNRELNQAGIQRNTRRARDWFQARVAALGRRINRSKLLEDTSTEPLIIPEIGTMCMFRYGNPVTKETLPFYDAFPLTIFMGFPEGGDLLAGVNIHYLHPIVRVKFLDALMETFGATNSLDNKKKLRLRYDLLKGVPKLKAFAPCYKHYRLDHVQSHFARVALPDWVLAAWLPSDFFQKKSREYVWSQSDKAIRGY